MAGFYAGVSRFVASNFYLNRPCPASLHRFVRTTSFRITRAVCTILGVLCALLASAVPASAQAVIAEGITQWSTQIKAGPVNIDMATGNMVFNIPARNKAGAIPFSFNLSDNFGNRGVVNSYNSFSAYMPSANLTGFHRPNLVDCGPPGPQTLQYGDNLHSTLWYAFDGTGSQHPFGFVDAILVGPLRQGCGGDWGPDTSISVDGSGYTAVVTGSSDGSQALSWVVYNKDGVKISSGLPGWTDPDGNTITISSNGLTTTYTDTLGQTVGSFTYGGGLQGGGHNGNPDQFFYTDSSGVTLQYYTVAYSSKHVKTVFTCTSPYADIDTTMYLPSTLTTPTGGQYTFTYEQTPGQATGIVTGRPGKITLPSGGYVQFTYGGSGTNVVNGFDCVSGIIPQLQVTLNDNNGHTSTTTYVNNNLTGINGLPTHFMVTETDQLGDVTTHYFYGEVETERIISDVTQGVLSTTLTCYNGNFSNCQTGAPGSFNRQTDVFTQMGSSGSWSLVETTLDGSGNTTTVSHWDWGLAAPGSAPAVAATSKTTTTYNGLNGASCGTLANAYQYNRPCSVTTVNSAGATVSQTNYTYTLGHPTQTSQWVSGTSWLTTSTAAYNSNGTVAWTKDAASNPTNYSYNGTGGCNGLLLTSTTFANNLTTSETWDCNGGVVSSTSDANATPNVTHYYYNDPLWRPTQVTYPDGGSTTTSYSTGTALPWTVSTSTAINSTTNLNSTAIYDGLGRTTQTQLTSDPDQTDYVDTTYDLLGRKATGSNPHRSASATTDGITTYTYDALDRVLTVTEPDTSKVSTAYSANCTTTTDEVGNARQSCVDGLGRLIKVLEDPGTSPHLNYETDYGYDALNNLQSVVQKGSDPAHPRPRSFVYDGLSRLMQATNPESANTSYTYSITGSLCAGDPSAVCTKAAPSPNQGSNSFSVTTSYTYDNLNRLTGKSYVDGYNGNPATHFVKYGYDGVALTGCTPTAPPGDPDSNPAGLRTSMCDGSGAASWKHDSMGRVLQERRTIGSVIGDYETDVYNLNGSPTTVTTLGYSVAYTYGGAGRPLSATNYTGGTNKLVSGATYTPSGELASMNMGSTTSFTGIVTTNAYNNRLQPILLSAGVSGQNPVFSLCFDFHLGAAITAPAPCSFSKSTLGDNGNVFQIVNNRNSTRSQSFNYDSLNRIANGQSSGTQWGESFTIDAWGNMTAIGSYNSKPHESLSTAANYYNQLVGFGYDAAGNMTSNGSASYFYDAENRVIATGGYSYIYDGDGRRVEKCTESTPGVCANGATGTLYWRGAASDPLSETDLSGNVQNTYIFFGRQRIARRDSAGLIHYYFSDHLGSHAVVENATATTCEQDIDYYPYGGQENDYCSGSGVSQHFKFTGKERDSESGLDNFGARFVVSNLGRFMTPDVPFADQDPADPQSWNLYSYVRNNPLRFTDPTGLWCVWESDKDHPNGSHDDNPNDGGADEGTCKKQGGHWDAGDTITGIVQDGNGNVTDIYYRAIGEAVLDYRPTGMTLEGFDQTQYEKVPAESLIQMDGPFDLWFNKTGFGRWWNLLQSRELAWEGAHPGAMDQIACGLAPDANNDLRTIARARQGKMPNPMDDSSGGSGGLNSFGAQRQNMTWMNNSNATKNGGQSLSVTPNGAATTSAGALAVDYTNSVGSCLQN